MGDLLFERVDVRDVLRGDVCRVTPQPTHHLGHRRARDERPVLGAMISGERPDAVQRARDRSVVRHTADDRLVESQAHVGKDSTLHGWCDAARALREREGEVVVRERHVHAVRTRRCARRNALSLRDDGRACRRYFLLRRVRWSLYRNLACRTSSLHERAIRGPDARYRHAVPVPQPEVVPEQSRFSRTRLRIDGVRSVGRDRSLHD